MLVVQVGVAMTEVVSSTRSVTEFMSQTECGGTHAAPDEYR
jgi:hypothetical protein